MREGISSWLEAFPGEEKETLKGRGQKETNALSFLSKHRAKKEQKKEKNEYIYNCNTKIELL